jgi:tRNA (cytosine34-C5)-methyltransferase
MLHQTETDKAPLLETFSEETRRNIATLERGSLVLMVEFQIEDDGPVCSLQLVGWKGAVSLRVYIPKHDRMHYLRLCGVDVSKFG